MTSEPDFRLVRTLDTPEAVVAYLLANPAHHRLCACEAWDSFCVEDGWFALAPFPEEAVWVGVPLGSAAHAWLETLEDGNLCSTPSVVAWSPWRDMWSLAEARGPELTPPPMVAEEGV